MNARSWLRLMGMFAAVAVFMALPLPAFAQNCALCYTQRRRFDRRTHDPGIAQRDFGPHHSSDSWTIGMIFVIHRRSNQFRMADDARTGARLVKWRPLTAWQIPTSGIALKSKLRDYYTLTKPEVNLLILMTTSAGYVLASHSPFVRFGLINTLVGTLLVASGTATLNQWMERVWDGRMRRTASRPLPSGRMAAAEALGFGLLLSVLGGLVPGGHRKSGCGRIGDSDFALLSPVYTPLKRKTPLCTLLGAFPGAMPTLIGWAGASGRIDPRRGFCSRSSFCGSSRIFWQLPSCTATTMPGRATRCFRLSTARPGSRARRFWV